MFLRLEAMDLNSVTSWAELVAEFFGSLLQGFKYGLGYFLVHFFTTPHAVIAPDRDLAIRQVVLKRNRRSLDGFLTIE